MNPAATITHLEMRIDVLHTLQHPDVRGDVFASADYGATKRAMASPLGQLHCGCGWAVANSDRAGVDGTGVADIAQEMGCSTGVLMHYYSSKAQLLLFAKNLLFDRVYDKVAKARRETRAWRNSPPWPARCSRWTPALLIAGECLPLSMAWP